MTEQGMERKPKLPEDSVEGTGLPTSEAAHEGDSKSGHSDEHEPADPTAVAEQTLSRGGASNRSSATANAPAASGDTNSARRKPVVQPVSTKPRGSDSPDVPASDGSDETGNPSTDATGDDTATATDTPRSPTDAPKDDAAGAEAGPAGPKLGAALAGRSDTAPFGAALTEPDSAFVASTNQQQGPTRSTAVIDAIDPLADVAPPESTDADSAKPALRVGLGPSDPSLAQPADAAATKSADHGRTTAAAPPPAPEPPPEARFAEVNHAKIVTGIHGELLPNGGAMHLRLDPPELGDLLVSVQMRDGVMTAAFQTSNDEATRLLSHSLGDLKATLEAQGVTVERLHVQQAPRQEQDPNSNARDGSGSRNPAAQDQHHARREQQRREMVQRLWDKLAGRDAVDLTA